VGGRPNAALVLPAKSELPDGPAFSAIALPEPATAAVLCTGVDGTLSALGTAEPGIVEIDRRPLGSPLSRSRS